MTKRWIIVSAAIAILTPSLAGARDWRATTAANRSIVVANQSSWHKDCSPDISPQIAVTEPPMHGHVSTRSSSIIIETASAGETQCIGKRVSGVGVVYTPEHNFRGTDGFAFTSSFPNGKMLEHRASVTVQ